MLQPKPRYLLFCITLIGVSSAQHSLPSRIVSGAAYFEPNRGPSSEDVLYLGRGLPYALEVTHDTVAMKFSDGAPLRMHFPYSDLEAAATLSGKSTSRQEAAATGKPHFARLRYRSVFPGVDLEVYNAESGAEYDWLVAPGADPSAIRVFFTGARAIRLDANGNLTLDTATGQIRHRAPRALTRRASTENFK